VIGEGVAREGGAFRRLGLLQPDRPAAIGTPCQAPALASGPLLALDLLVGEGAHVGIRGWVVIGAGVGIAFALSKTFDADHEPGRWRSVTILADADEISPGGVLPDPLRRLGSKIEVRTTDAPGDRGTELAARLVDGEPTGVRAALGRLTGRDPRQLLRIALRESKQLVEVGEVIRLDPRPAGSRPATPAGLVIDLLGRRSLGEGVL
jgi:hypothetical protein